MLVYHVGAGRLVAAEGVDVCIIAVDEYSSLCALQGDRQEVLRPEDAILRSPCVPWVAVQAMDEDDVDSRIGVIVDAGYLEALDLVEWGFGSLR